MTTTAQHSEPPTLIEHLATFAHAVSPENTSDPATRQAVLCLLDTIGCVIAGARTDEARKLYRAETETHGEFTHWPLEVRARLYGFLGDTLELNDLIGGHSSIGVVTASLIGATEYPITGSALVASVLAGTEVTARLYDSAIGHFKPYSQSGSVMVGYFNALGAAAALALMQGLDERATAQAMAIAAALTGWCPAEVIFGQGGTIKPLLFGAIPAESAVRATTYARHGLTGPIGLIESPIGMMASLATTFDTARVVDGRGWLITSPQRKLHASCGYTHSSIDAAHALSLTADEIRAIESIDVAVPEFFREVVGKTGAPRSANDARFHLGYVVALALQGNYPILPEHTLEFAGELDRGRTRDLSERVRIIPDDAVGAGASKPYNVSRVTVRFADGTERSATCLSPRGAADNPMSDDEVIQKFLRLVAPALGDDGARSLADSVLQVAEASSVAEVADRVGDAVAAQLNEG